MPIVVSRATGNGPAFCGMFCVYKQAHSAVPALLRAAPLRHGHARRRSVRPTELGAPRCTHGRTQAVEAFIADCGLESVNSASGISQQQPRAGIPTSSGDAIVALDTAPPPSTFGAGSPTTWTVLQQDGPNHLGLWYNVLPEHHMALITSFLCALQAACWPGSGPRARPMGASLTAAIHMDNPYCSCKLTRVFTCRRLRVLHSAL